MTPQQATRYKSNRTDPNYHSPEFMNTKESYKKLLYIFIFAVAMAFLESAVVVYLRALYYPDGFSFPLQTLDTGIAITELFRELATVIMLLGIAFIAAKEGIERFACFIFTFAVWDIFYYVFLKLLINWPESLLTWDVLFLIPVTWVGPVVGPVVNSLTMILIALLIFHFRNRGKKTFFNSLEWARLIIGSVIVLVSYTEEYTRYMLQEFSPGKLLFSPFSNEVTQFALDFIPYHFQWGIYLTGQLLFFIAIFLFYRRMKKMASS